MNEAVPTFAVLLVVTCVVVVPYLIARKAQDSLEGPGFSISDLVHQWRTRKMVLRIKDLVLMIGESTDGALKGQIPKWLAPHNTVNGGHGDFEVLVSSQGEYFMVHFKVERWEPRYHQVEPCDPELARKLMELHLEYLGRWRPLASV